MGQNRIVCELITGAVGLSVFFAAACGGASGETGGAASTAPTPGRGEIDSTRVVELPPTPTPGGAFVIPKVAPILGVKDVIPTLDPSAVVTGDPGRGRQLFETIGCTECHSTGTETVVGPGLGGVRLRAPDRVAQIKLVPRQTLSITPDKYIQDSIVNPQNFVVPGFENATKMESFAHLSRGELADVVAYVESLP